MIRLKGLKKSFPVGKNSFKVLKGIDLEVKTGEMLAIMGRSGAGKSTLLNILAGLDQPDSGEYWYGQDQISGKTLDELAGFRREKIGFILQNYPLIDSKNVFNNVALPLQYSNHKKNEIDKKVNEILSSLDISHLVNRQPDTLSGGEAQRVAIARALIQEPEVILADEPTGSLDEETEHDILNLFKDLNQKGNTIILATHSSQVSSVCNNICRIQDGIMYGI